MIREAERTTSVMCRNSERLSLHSSTMSKNEFVSSLVKKRRDNRRSKRPDLILDAVCNCAVARLQREISLDNLSRLTGSPCVKRIRRKRSLNEFGSEARNIKSDEDLEIEKMLGMDSFFEQVKDASISKRRRWDPPELMLSDDPLMNDLVLNFIETGTWPGLSPKKVDTCDSEMFSWPERIPVTFIFLLVVGKDSASQSYSFMSWMKRAS